MHVERRGNDNVTTVVRPDGDRIVTVVDTNGFLIRRSRILPDGREIIIIDNRPRRGGFAAGGWYRLGFFINLAPPVIRIPRDRYIVDYGRAPPGLIYETLEAPPVEIIERPYTLDEIRYSAPLRDRMPRIDLNTVIFESGSWELTPDQVEKLAGIADGLNRAIAQNPQEVFLIEGHTDAIGAAGGQSLAVGPPRGIGRHCADAAVRRAGGKSFHAGLRRTIFADPDTRTGARQPARRGAAHHAAAQRTGGGAVARRRRQPYVRRVGNVSANRSADVANIWRARATRRSPVSVVGRMIFSQIFGGRRRRWGSRVGPAIGQPAVAACRRFVYLGRHAPVAQLDRALPSEGRGHKFESCRARQ